MVLYKLHINISHLTHEEIYECRKKVNNILFKYNNFYLYDYWVEHTDDYPDYFVKKNYKGMDISFLNRKKICDVGLILAIENVEIKVIEQFSTVTFWKDGFEFRTPFFLFDDIDFLIKVNRDICNLPFIKKELFSNCFYFDDKEEILRAKSEVEKFLKIELFNNKINNNIHVNCMGIDTTNKQIITL
jgi:hypothetical protein